MKYKKHDFLLDMFYRNVRKQRGLSSKAARKQYDSIFATIWDTLSRIGCVVSCAACLDDCLMKEGGIRVIYPMDKDLLKSLAKASYQLLPGDFETPFQSFVLALPEGLEIDGEPIPSCVVRYENNGQRISRIKGIFRKHNYKPSFEYAAEDPSIKSLHIYYKSNDGTSYIRTSYPETKINECLQGYNPGKYRSMGGITRDVTDRDKKTTRTLFHIITGLSMYIRACPDKLIEGGPTDDNSKTALIKNKGRFSVHIPHTPSDKASPTVHWRSGHPRFLSHERYKRAENGAVRMVWVKGHMVGGKAYKVKGETE